MKIALQAVFEMCSINLSFKMNFPEILCIDTHKEKLFHSIQSQKCLQNQLSSIHSITRIKKYRCLKNAIHQIDIKNEWLLLSASFTPKFGLILF